MGSSILRWTELNCFLKLYSTKNFFVVHIDGREDRTCETKWHFQHGKQDMTPNSLLVVKYMLYLLVVKYIGPYPEMDITQSVLEANIQLLSNPMILPPGWGCSLWNRISTIIWINNNNKNMDWKRSYMKMK